MRPTRDAQAGWWWLSGVSRGSIATNNRLEPPKATEMALRTTTNRLDDAPTIWELAVQAGRAVALPYPCDSTAGTARKGSQGSAERDPSEVMDTSCNKTANLYGSWEPR